MIRHRRIFQRSTASGNSPPFTFLANGIISSRISYTQSGNLTYWGSNGLLQTAAVDTLPLEYYPQTSTVRGYPFWPARTNLCLWSRDYTNAAWVKVNVTAAKTATGIDGAANSASTLTATAIGGTILQTIVSGSAARITTWWVKRRTGTGMIEVTQDGVAYTDVTAQINSSTWSRVGPASATVTNPVLGFRFGTSGDAIDVDGTGLSNGTFPTAVIFTTTASVTRAAPTAVISGANFTSFYNQTEGTFFGHAEYASATTTGQYIVSANDGTTTNRIIILLQVANLLRYQGDNAGVNQWQQQTGNTLADNTRFGFAMRYKTNDFMSYFNGGNQLIDTSCSIPTVSQLNIGSTFSGSLEGGWIYDLGYYPIAQPAAVLASLST